MPHTLPQSLVQVTLNTGKLRVTPPGEADLAVTERCMENLRGGGGWSHVGGRTYVMLAAGRGTGRVTLAWKGQGVEQLVAGVVVWEEALARDAWTNLVAQAAESLSLPRLTMPVQLPWVAAFLTADALSQTKGEISRLGVITRTAAWAVLNFR